MVNIAINSHHLHHHLGQDFEIMGKAGKIVRLVRVMRVMRIFKLVRHFAGLQSLIYTLNQVSTAVLIPACSTLIGRGPSKLCSDWLKISYAIKTQLEATKASFTVS